MSDDESIEEQEPKEEAKEPEEEIVTCTSEDTIEINIDGKTYLMEKGDDEKCLYDKETGACVGTYDSENKEVKPLEDIDSDSDDE